MKLSDNSKKEIEFDKVILATGGDSGHVGLMMGLGLGQGDLR